MLRVMMRIRVLMEIKERHLLTRPINSVWKVLGLKQQRTTLLAKNWMLSKFWKPLEEWQAMLTTLPMTIMMLQMTASLSNAKIRSSKLEPMHPLIKSKPLQMKRNLQPLKSSKLVMVRLLWNLETRIFLISMLRRISWLKIETSLRIRSKKMMGKMQRQPYSNHFSSLRQRTLMRSSSRRRMRKLRIRLANRLSKQHLSKVGAPGLVRESTTQSKKLSRSALTWSDSAKLTKLRSNVKTPSYEVCKSTRQKRETRNLLRSTGLRTCLTSLAVPSNSMLLCLCLLERSGTRRIRTSAWSRTTCLSKLVKLSNHSSSRKTSHCRLLRSLCSIVRAREQIGVRPSFDDERTNHS